MFLGAASKNFQKSASPRKIRERVRVFLGTASENFTQSQPLRKKFGNVPECFWGLFRGSPPKSASPEKKIFRNVPECFRGPLKSPKKNSGTFPSVFGELRPKLGIFKRQSGTFPIPNVVGDCFSECRQWVPPRQKFGNVRVLGNFTKNRPPEKIELVVQALLRSASLKRRDPRSKNKYL